MQIFLLSPANCGGLRAQMLMRDEAQFDLAVRLRTGDGVTLAEAFTFLSGLYFRGKMAYAKTFAEPPAKIHGVQVITPDRGLVKAQMKCSLADLRRFAEVPVDLRESRYREPLERDAARLADKLPRRARVVLLGSIATGKYCDVLLKYLGKRLVFPAEFVGRGDMSRGGLMLRCVDEQRELTYIPVEGAVRHGSRPAKLPKREWARPKQN